MGRWTVGRFDDTVEVVPVAVGRLVPMAATGGLLVPLPQPARMRARLARQTLPRPVLRPAVPAELIRSENQENLKPV
jgi:hypothetical protein